MTEHEARTGDKTMHGESEKKFYVVLNPAGNEGFVTDSEDDAEYAATGFAGGCKGVSCVAERFREVYGNDPDDDADEFENPDEFEIHTIAIGRAQEHDPDDCAMCSTNEPCPEVVPEVSDLTDALVQIADALGCDCTLPDTLEAIESLKQVLRGCDAVANVRDGRGVADCIDNDGKLYQSAYLADLIAKSGEQA